MSQLIPKAVVTQDLENPKHYIVSADWTVAEVDRPISSSVLVTSKKVAERLARAIEDGVAYPYRGILTDVRGLTYVDAEHNIMARRANADLRRLGY